MIPCMNLHVQWTFPQLLGKLHWLLRLARSLDHCFSKYFKYLQMVNRCKSLPRKLPPKSWYTKLISHYPINIPLSHEYPMKIPLIFHYYPFFMAEVTPSFGHNELRTAWGFPNHWGSRRDSASMWAMWAMRPMHFPWPHDSSSIKGHYTQVCLLHPWFPQGV